MISRTDNDQVRLDDPNIEFQSIEGAGNFLFAASQQLERSHGHLEQLLANAPDIQGDSGYWSARQPGTASARRLFGLDTLHDFFAARLDLEFGLFRMTRSGWEAGHQIIELARKDRALLKGWTTFDKWDAEYIYLTEGLSVIGLPGSFVVFDKSKPKGPCLLFSLTWGRGVAWFNTRAELEALLMQNRKALWASQAPTQRLERANGVQFVERRGSDPFEDVCKETAKRLFDTTSSRTPTFLAKGLSTTDRSHIENRLAWEGANEIGLIHFASLDPQLPVAYRERAVEHMEVKVLEVLEDPKSSTRLERLQSKKALAARSRAYADVRLKRMLEATQVDDAALQECCDDRRKSCLEEARRLRDLKLLSVGALALVESTCMPWPRARTVSHTLVQQLALRGKTETWKINGAFVVLDKDINDEPAEDRSVLLYVPGKRGGLAEFDHLLALRIALAQTLGDSSDSVLLDNLPHGADKAVQAHLQRCRRGEETISFELATISGDAWLHSVRSQLSRYQQHEKLIKQGKDLYDYAPSSKESKSCLLHESLNLMAVPGNDALDKALERQAEQLRAPADADNIKTRLESRPGVDKPQLQQLLAACSDGFYQAQHVLGQTLPDREAFVDELLRPQLEKEFGLISPFKLYIELPRTVEAKGPSHAATAIPSEEKEWISLAELALCNLDRERVTQLYYMKVAVDSPITSNWSIRFPKDRLFWIDLVQKVDAAKQYEDSIKEAYSRSTRTMAQALHTEQLQEPWRKHFELQTLLYKTSHLAAVTRGILNDLISGKTFDEAKVKVHELCFAARNEEQRRDSTKRVVLPGVLLFESSQFKQTILYMPGVPTEHVFTDYAKPEDALRKLIEMATLANSGSELVRPYLALLPKDGESSDHARYLLDQKPNVNCIEQGKTVSGGETMAAYLCDLEREQRLTEHRLDSRSSLDAKLQRIAQYEAETDEKMAAVAKTIVGLVPGLGTVIDGYDFWMSANAAVLGYLNRDTKEGGAQLADAVISLFSIVMDAGPAAVAATAPGAIKKLGRTAKIARDRQMAVNIDLNANVKLKQPAAVLQGNSASISSRNYNIFEGRDKANVSLKGLTSEATGPFAGTYQIGNNLYIADGSNAYSVRYTQQGLELFDPNRAALGGKKISRGAGGRFYDATPKLRGGGIFLSKSGEVEGSGPALAVSGDPTPNPLNALKNNVNAKYGNVDEANKALVRESASKNDIDEFSKAVREYCKEVGDKLGVALGQPALVLPDKFDKVTTALKNFSIILEARTQKVPALSGLVRNLKVAANESILPSNLRETLQKIHTAIQDLQPNIEVHTRHTGKQWGITINDEPKVVVERPGPSGTARKDKVLSDADKYATQGQLEGDIKDLRSLDGVSTDSALHTMHAKAEIYQRQLDALEPFKGDKNVNRAYSTIVQNKKKILALGEELEIKHTFYEAPELENVSKLIGWKAVTLKDVGRLRGMKEDIVFRWHVENKVTGKLFAVLHVHCPLRTNPADALLHPTAANFKKPKEAHVGKNYLNEQGQLVKPHHGEIFQDSHRAPNQFKGERVDWLSRHRFPAQRGGMNTIAVPVIPPHLIEVYQA